MMVSLKKDMKNNNMYKHGNNLKINEKTKISLKITYQNINISYQYHNFIQIQVLSIKSVP